MNIGERIRNLRKAKNWTQAELAEKIHLTSGTLSAIEKNNSNTTTETIIKLSEIFEVSADFLLTGNEEPTGISKEEKEIIEVLRGDKDMTNAVMEFAKVKKSD